MKKLFFLSILLSFLSCSEKEKKVKMDCEDFKSGEFTYARTYTFEGKEMEFPKEYRLDTVRFIRKDNNQIEFYPEENESEVYEVEWQNNCSYDLVVVRPAFDIYQTGDRIKTRIISRTDTSYTFISESKHGELKGTIIKLK